MFKILVADRNTYRTRACRLIINLNHTMTINLRAYLGHPVIKYQSGLFMTELSYNIDNRITVFIKATVCDYKNRDY